MPTKSEEPLKQDKERGKGNKSTMPWTEVEPYVEGMRNGGLTEQEITTLLGFSRNFISSSRNIGHCGLVAGNAIRLLHENLRLKALTRGSISREEAFEIYQLLFNNPKFHSLRKKLLEVMES